ncbi:hypothetical protein [Streptomyces botrytidirepellens]|uniref:Uncharacterized protein n=1 Tax=Streptomyces botrytidirepellens TaxID=2486417 RepID=A0A3M8X547_9ACTN|nr:hypothetical protein [Streptomyces botrytidirepellens]RNG37356.1 hypothetical protein EEJ42_02215 [Streptomyces botrytidirepellens]
MIMFSLHSHAGTQPATVAPVKTRSFCADHPAWTHTPSRYPYNRYCYRLFAGEQDTKWLATWGDGVLDVQPLAGYTADADLPEITHTDLSRLLGDAPIGLVRSLASLGTVIRVSTPSLWEALSAQVIMQDMLVTAGRDSYRQWCRLYGAYWSTPRGPLYTAPDAGFVLGLPDRRFTDAGIGQATALALRAAAAAYLEQADNWVRFTGEQLVAALRRIRGVTLWTAAAAAVDYTGDGSCYPLESALDYWASQAAVSGHTRTRSLCEAVKAWAWSPERRHALTLAILTRSHTSPAAFHRSSSAHVAVTPVLS